MAGAGDPGRLDEQDVAAHRCPGEPGGDAGNAGAHGDLALEPGRPQDILQVFRLDPNMLRGAFGNPHRGVAQHRSDFPLELAHTCLTSVVADDRVDRCVGDLCLPGLQSIGFELPVDEIAAGDLELFVLDIAGQVDDLHAVAQWPRDAVENVGGRYEHDLR